MLFTSILPNESSPNQLSIENTLHSVAEGKIVIRDLMSLPDATEQEATWFKQLSSDWHNHSKKLQQWLSNLGVTQEDVGND